MAFFAPLPALIALKNGWEPFGIGLIAVVYSIGALLSNLIWPHYISSSTKAGMLSLGFLGVILGALLLQNPSTLIISVLVLSTLPQSAYYVLLNEVKSKKGNLSENVALFHQSTSLGNLTGLVIGMISSYFLTIEQLPFVLFSLALFSTLLISQLIDEEGLSPLVIRGIKEIKKMNKQLNRKRKSIKKQKVDFKKFIPYLIMSSAFSISNGTTGAQFTTILKILLKNPSLYYLFSIFSDLSIIATYRVAGKIGSSSLKLSYVFRTLGCLSLIASTFNKWFILLFTLLGGIYWGFLSTFYTTSNLKAGKNILSINRVTRSISYMIASYFSGTLLELTGIMGLSIFAMISALLGAIPYFNSQKVLKYENTKSSS